MVGPTQDTIKGTTQGVLLLPGEGGLPPSLA